MSIQAGGANRMPMAQLLRGAATTLLSGSALCYAVAVANAETLLTLSRGPHDIEVLEFTMEELAEFPQVTIETENVFVNERVAYRGPLVRDIIGRLPLGDADVLRFTAANDYSIDIPTIDFHTYDVILAMEANGKPLARRDKGPLWLMYPISDFEKLQDPLFIQRLIWQLVRIESL